MVFGKKPPATIIVLEAAWPQLHAVAISQSEVWGFMCFHTKQMNSSIIERNLIPKQALTSAIRFQLFFGLYDYDRAYAELPVGGIANPEKIMVDLNNDEIYVLLRAQYRQLGDQFDRQLGNCRQTLVRMTELAELVKPPPATRD